MSERMSELTRDMMRQAQIVEYMLDHFREQKQQFVRNDTTMQQPPTQVTV